MREMTVEQLAAEAGKISENLHSENILLTQDGKPIAVVVGLEEYDAEDIAYMTDPEFWKMIEQRRREPTIPFESVKAELLRDDEVSK